MRQKTALLVIDMQVGLVDGPQLAFRRDDVLACIVELVRQARATDTTRIFIQDDDVGTGVDSPGWQLHAALTPQDGELVLRKPYADSFYKTSLHEALQAQGISHLIITGMKTEVCVDMTSRRAVALGYDVTLVSDGHTTTDGRAISAQQIVAYHNELLWDFGVGDGFGCDQHYITVTPAREIVFG